MATAVASININLKLNVYFKLKLDGADLTSGGGLPGKFASMASSDLMQRMNHALNTRDGGMDGQGRDAINAKTNNIVDVVKTLNNV